MRRWKQISAVLAMGVLGLVSRGQAAQSPKDWGFGKPYAYIIWDGHRFARTPADHERDVRYFRDLGFTHSLTDAELGAVPAATLAARQSLFTMAHKYDLVMGLRYGWSFAGLKQPWEELLAAGATLSDKKTKKDVNDYNPVHPTIIDGYVSGLLQSFNSYRTIDPGERIRFFLIGSEYSCQLPAKDKCPPAAVQVILKAARQDGALGATEDDWTKVKAWWSGPFSKGGDWRIRKAVADGVHKTVPDAMFMIDPIWCVKLVEGGFGGHWSYIGKGMVLGMADEAVRIMAQCWPQPATHSTQLIQGAQHDLILEGNLLGMAMGLPSLYHWGINIFEPGRSANPYYRYKGDKSPEAEASLRKDIVEKRLEKEPALRSTGRFIRERGQMLHDWTPLEPRVAYVAGLYGPADPHLAMMAGQIPFDLLRNQHHRDSELAKYKFILLAKSKGPMAPVEYEKLLKLEKSGAALILPKGFMPPEGARPFSRPVEWDPEIVGESITAKKGIGFAGDYTALQEHMRQGSEHLRAALSRAGFKPYFDIKSVEVVSRPYEYKGHAMLFVVNDKRVAAATPLQGAPDEVAGDPDAQAVISEKNAAKNIKKDAGSPAITGVPAEIEVLIRDNAAGLKVIDIDTGSELKLEPCPEGQKFKDTVPGAWYRIYAVIKPGQAYQGPPPLKPAPAVVQFTAARTAGGVKLEWKTDVPDWVGCDAQWFRIYRGEGNAEPKLLKQIYGRSVEEAGGLVTGFVDAGAAADKPYGYKIQAVSPLRIPGPLSAAAKWSKT